MHGDWFHSVWFHYGFLSLPNHLLKGQYAVDEVIRFFVYIQVYVVDYCVTNMEMVESNVYVLVGSTRFRI